MSKTKSIGGKTDLTVTTVYMPCEDCTQSQNGQWVCAQAGFLSQTTIREMHRITIIRQNRPAGVLAVSAV